MKNVKTRLQNCNFQTFKNGKKIKKDFDIEVKEYDNSKIFLVKKGDKVGCITNEEIYFEPKNDDILFINDLVLTKRNGKIAINFPSNNKVTEHLYNSVREIYNHDAWYICYIASYNCDDKMYYDLFYVIRGRDKKIEEILFLEEEPEVVSFGYFLAKINGGKVLYRFDKQLIKLDINADDWDELVLDYEHSSDSYKHNFFITKNNRKSCISFCNNDIVETKSYANMYYHSTNPLYLNGENEDGTCDIYCKFNLILENVTDYEVISIKIDNWMAMKDYILYKKEGKNGVIKLKGDMNNKKDIIPLCNETIDYYSGDSFILFTRKKNDKEVYCYINSNRIEACIENGKLCNEEFEISAVDKYWYYRINKASILFITENEEEQIIIYDNSFYRVPIQGKFLHFDDTSDLSEDVFKEQLSEAFKIDLKILNVNKDILSLIRNEKIIDYRIIDKTEIEIRSYCFAIFIYENEVAFEFYFPDLKFTEELNVVCKTGLKKYLLDYKEETKDKFHKALIDNFVSEHFS